MRTTASRSFTLSSALLIASLIAGCEFHLSTANIKDATLAKDVSEAMEPVDPTTTFATNDRVIHCLVTLGNAPDETKVKAEWKTVNVEGVPADQTIVANDVEGGGGKDVIDFTMKSPNDLPPGDYKVNLYLNPRSDGSSRPEKSLNFSVK
jgi:hypothetical protein